MADVAEAHQNRLEAEVLLKKSKMPDKTNPDLTALERRLSEVERKLDLLLNQGDDRQDEEMSWVLDWLIPDVLTSPAPVQVDPPPRACKT